MPIRLLQREEPVERGLFFFQDGPYPIADSSIEKATGMAFLVREDGVVITCSHVLLHLNAMPTEVVTLHHVWRGTPVSIDAMVLDRGWHGPDWQSLIDHPSRDDRDWLRESQLKPETFKEDCALLRLLPDTARWDFSRGSSGTVGSAPLAFLEDARVLPLGFPGYQHASNAPCTAWNVEYQEMAARSAPHSVAFRGQGHPGKDNRFDGKSIGPGHSGGPVWDDERRLVVGMIRGAGASDDAGSVLAVDSRWISAITESPLRLDLEAQQIRQLCRQVAQQSATLRYLSLLQAAIPTDLLPLRAVRLNRDQDALQRRGAQDSGEDALTTVLRSLDKVQSVLVVGGAGSGKTTLLYQLAMYLLDAPNRSILPVLVSASAFVAAGCDIAQVLGATEDSAKRVRRSIRHNGLHVILLIDALDEVDIKKRAEVFARVGSLGFSVQTVFSSRPFEDYLGATFLEVPCFALQPLTEDEVQTLASQHLSDAHSLERFRQQASDVAWEDSAPVPLQVVMALYAYQADLLDVTRPMDLTFVLSEHLVRDAFEIGNPGLGIAEGNRFLLMARQVALRFMKGANTRAEFVACVESISLASGDPEGARWLRTASASGLITFQGTNDRAPVMWPHRTIAEGLAAQAVADQAAASAATATQEFSEALRRQGRTFAIMILAALDRSVFGRPLAQVCMRRHLRNGVSDYKSTLTAVQILGSGISLDDDLRDRFVALLVVLLLMPPGQRVGTSTCAEFFSPDRLPDPVGIARRDHVKPHVLAFMNRRLSRRQKGVGIPVAISPREEMLLSRLEMMGQLSVPVQTGKAFGPATSQRPRAAVHRVSSEPVDEGAYAALMLRTAIERLQSDATGFLSGLVQHAKAMPSEEAEVVVGTYIQGLLSIPESQ